jgi:uncharacterized ferritin-like protein (DUF455 family)
MDPALPPGGLYRIFQQYDAIKTSTDLMIPTRDGKRMATVMVLSNKGVSAEWRNAADAVPFALKLDMARQAWDEARHVEISVKLSDWMGGEIGEYAENTVLFQAACSTDPILRLAGVNRALEGLAIDVFTTMRDFAVEMNDDVLYYAEDWMLADEVTHVKMGSDWLRKVTANDPQRQKDALEFQKAVDKLFSFGGFRGERDDNPVHLARNFRKLAGFSEE